MVTDIRVQGQPELKRLCGAEADRIGIPLSEWIVRVLAEKIGRPDLSHIPRKRPGRPRKDLVA